ncbi:MAG: ATP-binding cassette domain-containing protein [Bacteroidales bacterium]|nr:ATP-binding cassette domain-containing protein [Bacteroidales bacterium]
MDRERILHIENLVKSFDGVTVIRGVSLSLFRGEHLVVLGKSGSGKSVIMKCVVKLMEADSGSIHLFGTDIGSCSEIELAAVRHRTGYLFQEGALYDSMTIRENLLFPSRRNPTLKKLSEKELQDLAEHNLENVGLKEAIDKMPAELSGGMKKRAGLARTLMRSPELIIYDEPTTGLDPFTGEAIIELILKIRETYRTSAIIITHDIKCAELTGDRLLVLSDGTIIGEGPFNELKNHPEERVRLFFR